MITRKRLYNKTKKQILKNLKRSLKYCTKYKFSYEICIDDSDAYRIIAKYLFSKGFDFDMLDNGNLMVKWGKEN